MTLLPLFAPAAMPLSSLVASLPTKISRLKTLFSRRHRPIICSLTQKPHFFKKKSFFFNVCFALSAHKVKFAHQKVRKSRRSVHFLAADGARFQVSNTINLIV